jgi:hypothetical protein
VNSISRRLNRLRARADAEGLTIRKRKRRQKPAVEPIASSDVELVELAAPEPPRWSIPVPADPGYIEERDIAAGMRALGSPEKLIGGMIVTEFQAPRRKPPPRIENCRTGGGDYSPHGWGVRR